MPCLKNATRWLRWFTSPNRFFLVLVSSCSWTLNPPILGRIRQVWIFQQWAVVCNRPLLRFTTRTNCHRSMSIANRLRNVSYAKRKQVWRLPINAGEFIFIFYLSCRSESLSLSLCFRCGSSFCSEHRYPEAHACAFDYKAEGKRLIERNNPLVTAPKLPKIWL